MSPQYIKQIGLGLAAQNECAEIKLRAERKMGGMLREMPKLHGARPPDTGSHDVTPLSDLGISKMQSHRLQLIDFLPGENFEEYIRYMVENDNELTSAKTISRIGIKESVVLYLGLHGDTTKKASYYQNLLCLRQAFLNA